MMVFDNNDNIIYASPSLTIDLNKNNIDLKGYYRHVFEFDITSLLYFSPSTYKDGIIIKLLGIDVERTLPSFIQNIDRVFIEKLIQICTFEDDMIHYTVGDPSALIEEHRYIFNNDGYRYLDSYDKLFTEEYMMSVVETYINEFYTAFNSILEPHISSVNNIPGEELTVMLNNPQWVDNVNEQYVIEKYGFTTNPLGVVYGYFIVSKFIKKSYQDYKLQNT